MKVFIDGKLYDTDNTPIILQPADRTEAEVMAQSFGASTLTGKPLLCSKNLSDDAKESFFDEYEQSIK